MLGEFGIFSCSEAAKATFFWHRVKSEITPAATAADQEDSLVAESSGKGNE